MKDLKVYSNTTDTNRPHIVMLHGYGANGRDLIGLSQFPQLAALNFNWHFLEAPLSPPELAAFGGKAWFNLTLSSFASQMQSEDFSGFYNLNSPEFKNSLEKIRSSIWNLNLKGEVYIGGFSQGAMMASNVFFQDPESYKALIALSGAPFQNQAWKPVPSHKRAFVSHGQTDQVLPLQCGLDLEKKLSENLIEVEAHWFRGGHEIPPQVLSKLSLFLS